MFCIANYAIYNYNINYSISININISNNINYNNKNKYKNNIKYRYNQVRIFWAISPSPILSRPLLHPIAPT